MKTDGVHHLIRNRLLARAGLLLPPVTRRVSLKELQASEWSADFERLQRNRLIMGALRYGKLGAPGKPKYDRVASIQKRMDQYTKTGNLELLVDVANLCVCEFIEGRHPTRHFRAEDDGEHVAGRILDDIEHNGYPEVKA